MISGGVDQTDRTQADAARCLTYCPLPYNGRGPSKSCFQIVEHFPDFFASSRIYLPKSRKISESVAVINGLPDPLNALPWKLIRRPAKRRIDRLYEDALRKARPGNAVAYFWPAPSLDTVRVAKESGIVSVREMINCATGMAKPILEEAFGMAGMRPNHTIRDGDIERETIELSHYDYIFSSNQEVDASLRQAGVEESRILKTSFGWNPKRFGRISSIEKNKRFTAIFVGTIGVRKGVVPLVSAWKLAKLPGDLLLVGNVDEDFAPELSRLCSGASIKVIEYTNDIEALYKSSHLFVFPTFEEGGPQVTYEAAGCGLPALTTPMGAGRLITHGRNGIVAAAGNVQALADGLRHAFEDHSFRNELAENARRDAAAFTYEVVGRDRARMLRSAMQSAGRGP